jgi:putative heme-binding domain-containing protein
MHRDYESLMRDIVEPNATINPDAVAYMVTKQDGSVAVGTRIGETAEELKLAAPGGGVTIVKKSEIKKSEVMRNSLMPPGLLGALTEQEVKDLMTFLMSPVDKEK